MSREYYFYPAEKREDGYYPALLEPDEEGMNPATCHWNNADYMSDEDKDIISENLIDPRLMKGEFVKYMNLDNCSDDDFRMMFVYELSYDFIKAHAGSGLVIGYMPVNTVIEAKQDDMPLSEYKYSLITPDIYAEHPHKDKFMRVSFIDYMSLEHICGILYEAIQNLQWYKKDLCVLAHYSF